MFSQLLNKVTVDIDPKKTTIECDKRIISLIKRSFPQFNNVVGLRDNNVTPDITVSLSSLTERYLLSLKSFSISPYLKGDPELISYWADKLSELGNTLKIGFAWQGGIKQYSRFQATKSITIDALEPFFSIKNTFWVNLQYGDVSEELKDLLTRYSNIVSFKEIDPLMEIENQFALISNLDLVIQPSNASIHFAGALGVKSWVLLGNPHDFRWFANGKDDQSAWYPSVRMIKKGQKQSWQELIESLVPELTALAATKS